MRLSKLMTSLGAVFMVVSLAACDMTVPSQLETGQIRLDEQVKTVQLDAARVDTKAVRAVMADFRQNGRGQMAVVMAYQSGNPLHETEVRRNGAAWQRALTQQSGKPVQVNYVAVEDKALTEKAVLSYAALTALPPEGCRPLTGYRGGDSLEGMQNYRFGCETRTAISRMIVNPDDLKGREGLPSDDARRQGNVAERYMSGEPLPPLETTTASSIGG